MGKEKENNQFLILRGSERDVREIRKKAKEMQCFDLLYFVDAKTKSYDLEFLNIIASESKEVEQE